MKQKIFAVTITFLILFGMYSFFTLKYPNKKVADCANSITCIQNLEADVDNDSQAIFLGNTIEAPKIDLAQDTINSNILGDESNSEEKHI